MLSTGNPQGYWHFMRNLSTYLWATSTEFFHRFIHRKNLVFTRFSSHGPHALQITPLVASLGNKAVLRCATRRGIKIVAGCILSTTGNYFYERNEVARSKRSYSKMPSMLTSYNILSPTCVYLMSSLSLNHTLISRSASDT